jgi:predicted Zn-dependent protease
MTSISFSSLSTRGMTWLSGALVSATLMGCQAVQTTEPGAVGIDRTQRMSSLVSEAELQKGAAQAYQQVLAKEKARGTLNANPQLTQRVRGIAQRLIPATASFRPDAPKWDWEVNVIQEDQLNAWVMPGGKMAIYSGLIEQLKLTDDEIAAIVGHEMAHALREHARERASEQQLASVGLAVGAAVLGLGRAGTDLAGLAYQVSVGMPNSRAHEVEADRIGVEIAARAGYDPRAAVTLWQKMQQRAGGAGTPQFLSTHPSPANRLKDLEAYAARVMPLYEQARKR